MIKDKIGTPLTIDMITLVDRLQPQAPGVIYIFS